MSNRIINIFVFLTMFISLSVINACSQDLTAFEVIDNESIGLTVAPFSKYGMAVADIDRNGYPDILCIRWSGQSYSRIYINDGSMFQDISDQSPFEQIENEVDGTRTCLLVDYDNDGDKDISVSTDLGIHLFRNDNNVFTDVSGEMGFVGQIPPGFISSWKFTLGGWADYDMDGDLDCVVGQENNEHVYLFRNDGDHFTDLEGVGLDSVVEAGSRHRLTWTDIDLDGDPDLFASYNFFRNDNGYFTEITDELGFTELGDVVRREFFDYDLDGDFDFFKAVGNATAAATNEMWENRDGGFVNVSEDVGLTLSRDRYRGMTIGDFENDGDEDIFIQLNIDPSLDVLLLNDEIAPGERAFADVSEFVGITKTGDRKGSVFFDYDRDGFLDIYLPSAEFNHILYHNLAINEANWVGFIIEGTLSNRDAVGSLITLYTPEKTQIRYTKCGNGFVRQDNPWVHFGIGFETTIDSVVIRWPLGYRQVITDVAINQYHDMKEPDYSSVQNYRDKNSKAISFKLNQNYPNPFNPKTNIEYSISKTTDVEIVVYDINGRAIITLVNQKQNSGFYNVTWDGRDEAGKTVSTGIYIYKMKANEQILSKKMALIK
jgi:hypothetical protein